MDYDASLLAVCGGFCANCVRYLGGRSGICPGCNVHKGHPSWGECRVYSCVAEHDAGYCGTCDEFPCGLIMNYCDPGNPEGPRNAAIRVAVNAYRARRPSTSSSSRRLDTRELPVLLGSSFAVWGE